MTYQHNPEERRDVAPPPSGWEKLPDGSYGGPSAFPVEVPTTAQYDKFVDELMASSSPLAWLEHKLRKLSRRHHHPAHR